MPGLLDFLLQGQGGGAGGLLGNLQNDSIGPVGLLQNIGQPQLQLQQQYQGMPQQDGQNVPFNWGIGNIDPNPSGAKEDVLANSEALLNGLDMDAKRRIQLHKDAIARYDAYANDMNDSEVNRRDWAELRDMRRGTLLQTLQSVLGPGKSL